MKVVFVLQTVVFQGSTPYWSAAVRTHESSLINASVQNVTQHHCCYSLMGCLIQPSNHNLKKLCWRQLSSKPRLNETNTPNCSQTHLQSLSVLLSNSTNLLPTTIHTNLLLTWNCGSTGKNSQGDINIMFLVHFYFSTTKPIFSPNVSLDLTNFKTKKLHNRKRSHSLPQQRQQNVKRKINTFAYNTT